MLKVVLDSTKHVNVITEGSMIIITSYSKDLKAVKAGFSYLPARRMIGQIKIIFENEKEIIDKLKTAGKIKTVDGCSIDHVCLFYCGHKLIISKKEDEKEMLKKFLKAEQG